MDSKRLASWCASIGDWGTAAGLFGVPIYFAWFQENFSVFDLNKSALLRFIVLILVGAWLARASIEGTFRFAGDRKVIWLLAMFVALAAVSTAVSLHPGISFTGTYERQQGLYNIISYGLLFFMIISSSADRRQIRRLISALLAGGAVACLYGLLQIFGFDPLRWAEDSPRIFSSFGQPNFFGHYIVVLLPLTVYAAVWQAKRTWQKAACGVFVILELICLYCTFSRSAWFAFAALVVLGIIWFALYMKRNRLAVILGACVIAATLVLLIPATREKIASLSSAGLNPVGRIASAFDLSAGSSRIRIIYWQAGWKAFKEASLIRQAFGYGPDVLGDVFATHYRPEWAYYEQLNTFPDRAHNTVLDMLLHFGLFGLLAFAGASFWVWIRLLRRSLSAEQASERFAAAAVAAVLAAYFFNNLFSFSLTSMNVVLYGLLAIGCLMISKESRTISLGFFHPVSRWCISVVTIGVLAVFWYTFSLRPLIADMHYMDLKRGEAQRDCRRVIDALERMVSSFPSGYYYQRMYLYHATNCFSAAAPGQSRDDLAYNLLIEARLLESGNDAQYYAYTDLAHMYSILTYYHNPDYYGRAVEYYEKMIAINPWLTTAYQDYGRLKLWRGDSEGAIELFRRGLEAMPDYEAAPDENHRLSISYTTSYFNDLIAEAYLNAKDVERAKRQLELAISIDGRLTSPYEKLGAIYVDEKKYEEAIALYRRGYELDSLNAEWPRALARTFRIQGKREQALKYAAEALALNPDDKEAKSIEESYK